MFPELNSILILSNLINSLTTKQSDQIIKTPFTWSFSIDKTWGINHTAKRLLILILILEFLFILWLWYKKTFGSILIQAIPCCVSTRLFQIIACSLLCFLLSVVFPISLFKCDGSSKGTSINPPLCDWITTVQFSCWRQTEFVLEFFL